MIILSDERKAYWEGKFNFQYRDELVDKLVEQLKKSEGECSVDTEGLSLLEKNTIDLAKDYYTFYGLLQNSRLSVSFKKYLYNSTEDYKQLFYLVPLDIFSDSLYMALEKLSLDSEDGVSCIKQKAIIDMCNKANKKDKKDFNSFVLDQLLELFMIYLSDILEYTELGVSGEFFYRELVENAEDWDFIKGTCGDFFDKVILPSKSFNEFATQWYEFWVVNV